MIDLTFDQVQKRLNDITQEMIALIHKYDLDAQDPLQVIPVAKAKIHNEADYIRFLELSLEGRIYGDVGEAIQKAEAEAAKAAKN